MYFEDSSTNCNTYSIMREIQLVQTEIGRLQFKLLQLQSKLDAEYSKYGWNNYTCNNPDIYTSFN